jgi:hypothetical protein
MKLNLVIIALAFLGCNVKTPNTADTIPQIQNSGLAKELIDNGFLKYADSSKIESLKAEMMSTFYIYNEDNCKIAHIDAEELAEFSFDFFLPNLNKMLAKRNFKLSAKKLNNDDRSFDAEINSERVDLFTQKDMDDNSFWDKAPRNFFKKLNKQLSSSNVEEQFYLLYSGNDLQVMLLTSKQFSIIAQYYNGNLKETPYLP